MTLRDIPLSRTYEGPGSEILLRFVLPCLSQASSYDRVASWFTARSLVAAGAGIEQLWRRGGKMRLIIGIHDVPASLVAAAIDDPALAQEVDRLRHELLRELT